MTPRLVLPLLSLTLVTAATSVAAEPPCVSVRIGGEGSRYYDCLNQDLERQVRAQQGRMQQLDSVRENSRPDTDPALGLYNQAATRMRMGNTFGQGVRPQRPPVEYHSPFPVR